MVTLYTYDTLDNLTCVEQHGTATGQTGCSSAPSNDSSSAWRIRRFTYDSLGRLVTATNPESGAISYTYDSDGNVLTKYDARGITTTMTYDQLHRVLSKTYSDGTPTATYIYDVAATDGPGSSANPIGRLVEVKNSNAKEVDSYDTRGRIAAQWQCTPLNCGSSWFNLGYSYNYAGGLISESTPMGFTLTPAYDPAARLKTLTSSWSDAQHPANLLTVDATAGYTPAGALAKMTYGNGLVETSTYNNRLEPTQLRTYNPTTSTDVLNLTYGFTDSAGSNNGNVVTFNSSATQIFMRTYTYDELNRLSTMSSPADASGCYGLSWTYDAWGNRLSQNTTSGACGSPSHGVSALNRIIDTGYAHDSAGNMTSDNVHTYTLDAENRITSMDSGAATYVYDASGQRVRKTTGGVTTDYVYDESHSVVAEIQGSTWTKGYAYAGSHLLAQYNGALGSSGATTVFSHADHLGSVRVVSAVSTGVSDSIDYLPFGEQITGGSGTTHKFTGKERDSESGLDYFEARYMGSNLGRFMSSDPVYLELNRLSDPQQLNLYAYARNNPLNLTDSTGLDISVDGKKKKDYLKALQKDVSFTVAMKHGKIVTKGAIGANLSVKEKVLLAAINDDQHHVTIHAVDGKKDPSIEFGRDDGPGEHTIAFGQAKLLDSPGNAGGVSSAGLVGHETVEAYAETLGVGESGAHSAAGILGFPGFGNPTLVGGHESKGLVDTIYEDFQVGETRTKERVGFKLVTPVPKASITPNAHLPNYPSSVTVGH